MRQVILALAVAAGSAQAQQTDVRAEIEVVEGDVLLIEKIERAPKFGPRHGIKKAEVERRYGEPVSRNAPVGDPPISSWVYPDFTVYFEYDTVLHSVSRA